MYSQSKPHGQGRHCKKMSDELSSIVREEHKEISRIRREERKKRFSACCDTSALSLVEKAKRVGEH